MRLSRLSLANVLLGSTLFVFTWRPFSYQPAQPQCQQITLTVSLKAGQSFEKPIGGTLTLKVHANTGLTPPNGWNLFLADPAGHDYIAPVNPPLRFNPVQTLGPGYGLTASESLSWAHVVRFILSNEDYERIAVLWRYASWPADAPDPDHAIENWVSALRQLRTGFIRARTLKFDVSPDGILRSATFRFALSVPSGFSLNPALGPQPAQCNVEPTVPLGR